MILFEEAIQIHGLLIQNFGISDQSLQPLAWHVCAHCF